MTERVNNIILEALQQGIPPQTIFDEFRKIDDPDIQTYLKRYQQNVNEFEKPVEKEAPPLTTSAPVNGSPSVGPVEAAIAGGTAGLVGVGAKALYNKYTKEPKEAVAPNEKVSAPVKSPIQEEMEKLKLKQEQIKTEQLQKKYEMFIAKNTQTEAEKILGRKITDPADQRIAEALLAQQKQKAGFGQGPSLQSALPSTQPQFTTSATTPNVTTSLPALQQEASQVAQVAEAADNAAANKTQPPTTVNQQLTPPASAGTPNGQVVSTGATPAQAEAPIAKTEELKQAVEPTPEPPKAKKEPKIPRPEFFNKASSAERHIYGTYTKFMDQPASAQAVVARAADYLPEGTKFEMQPGNEGGGLHPEQKPHFNKFVSENLGIPLDKEGNFPKDFRFTGERKNQLAASVQSELEQHAKAGTLGKLGKGALAAAAVLGISSAVQAAQKGDFGPLQEAGFDIGLSAIPHPAVQAAVQGLTGTTLQPGTLPTSPSQAFERNVLGRKGIKEELSKLTAGKTGAEFNAIRDQYLYGNPRAVSDYDRYVQYLQKQTRQPVVPR